MTKKYFTHGTAIFRRNILVEEDFGLLQSIRTIGSRDIQFLVLGFYMEYSKSLSNIREFFKEYFENV